MNHQTELSSWSRFSFSGFPVCVQQSGGNGAGNAMCLWGNVVCRFRPVRHAHHIWRIMRALRAPMRPGRGSDTPDIPRTVGDHRPVSRPGRLPLTSAVPALCVWLPIGRSSPHSPGHFAGGVRHLFNASQRVSCGDWQGFSSRSRLSGPPLCS